MRRPRPRASSTRVSQRDSEETRHAPISVRRRGRRRHRGLGRRGRHPGQRALSEGRQDGGAGVRQAPHARRLRQRRVALVQAARLARPAHHLGLLPGRPGLPEPAELDLQDGRRHDRALGRLLPALPGARVQVRDLLRAARRREHARLADRAGRPRALLPARRGQDGHRRRRTGSRRCPPTTTSRSWATAPSASATRRSTPAATPPTRCRATGARRRSRTASTSRASRTTRSGPRSSSSCPRPRRRASSTCARRRTSSGSSTTTRASPPA